MVDETLVEPTFQRHRQGGIQQFKCLSLQLVQLLHWRSGWHNIDEEEKQQHGAKCGFPLIHFWDYRSAIGLGSRFSVGEGRLPNEGEDWKLNYNTAPLFNVRQ
jgi:hypothetical protein